jgi:hypothetical protein
MWCMCAVFVLCVGRVNPSRGPPALILSFWRECAKLFDVNGDGQINRLEAVTLLDALGMSNLTDDEIDKLVSPSTPDLP